MAALTRARWPFLALAAVGSLLVGVAVGAVSLPLDAIASALFRNAGPDAAIVRDLRVPRVLLGFLVGGSLSVSGAILQALIRNPLADPYLLGLSGGAAVGAVGAIALGLASAWALPVAAFVGGLLTLALVYRLSLVDRRRMDPHTLLLAGVVVSAFTGAVLGAVLSLSDAAGSATPFSGCWADWVARPGKRSEPSPSTPCRPWHSCSGTRAASTSWPWEKTPPGTWAPIPSGSSGWPTSPPG